MSRARALSIVAVAALAVACLASCASPDFKYAAQRPGSVPAGTVYFKVPWSWTEFPAEQIVKAQQGWSADSTAKTLLDATTWQSAYDAAPQPSLTDVFGTGTPEAPVVYASLRSLYSAESDAATSAALRDMVVPLSTLGTAVNVTTDDVMTQGKVTGVHVVYSYLPLPGAAEITIDQTSYLSAEKDAVYLLVVRCSTTCYAAHRDEISRVVSSYTIQED
ncbi:unannotated protein [freshwater metagenome]|uniref:Unannotated protein n=1 Tax=freshwater metagenome TaxID=449393 RepID=A0A6J7BXY2_9ZZZZ|nr:hypothetical protein [Actinomycetota bacterium]MSW36544.1 hypothetical protein [Actinomycetota bacterium]MSX38594.1 hypothetical protein [Actinomycetota bacterium]